MNFEVALEQTKIISIIRGATLDQTIIFLETIKKAGIILAEITLNTSNCFDIIKTAREKFSTNMLIGAGTVTNLEDCVKAVESGAQFIVTPNMNTEVIKYCVDKDIPITPGVFSPSEVYNALLSGAKYVKIFPISVLGSHYIKELSGPFGAIKCLAVGGINLENAKEYINNGAIGIGIGSYLCNLNLLNEEKYDQIYKNAISLVNVVNSI